MDDRKPDGVDTGEVLAWVELCAWIMLALTPVIWWLQGPSVSTDQFVVRSALIVIAGTVAVALRTKVIVNHIRNRFQETAEQRDSDGIDLSNSRPSRIPLLGNRVRPVAPRRDLRMLPETTQCTAVFDATHYATTPWQKLKRSVQLVPRYYAWDLPRYLWHRRASGLSVWDWQALWNPLRELRSRVSKSLEPPERFQDALELLFAAGVRLTLPPARVAGLAAVWWATRKVPGDVMECGAYRGATSLLLAVLGRLHSVPQTVLILDTFCGLDETCAFDVSRTGREYIPPEDQVAALARQAAALGVEDRIAIRAGRFCDTFDKVGSDARRFAMVHIDANLYQGTLEACQFALPRMSGEGIVVFDDYAGVCDLGARLAIDRVLASLHLHASPLAGYSAFVRIQG